MRIIFLDFDGVLNSSPYLMASAGQTVEVYEALGDAGALDPVAVEQLNELTRQTGAVVVVSSSWRHGREVTVLREMLKSRGFIGEVIGRTPHFVPNKDPLSKRQCGERGDEIQAWLDAAPQYDIEVESFIILDDNSDMAHLRDRLVQTQMDSGLTTYYVQKAVKMLTEPRSLLVIPTAETVARFVP